MRTLPADLAAAVARRLVAASLADEPETGYQLARDARRLAARVGIVRETVGIAAYRAGHWAEALTELRAARRLTGRTSYLPMMADSERALGRLDRALALVTEPQAGQVDRATQIELLIVESGIRRDQGLPEAAAVTLQVPELTDRRLRPWSARLFYAYADALLDAGRTEEARDWFGRAAEADRDEQTDAAERYEDLDDVVIDDLEDDLGDENRDDDPSDDEDPDDEDPDGEDPDGEDPDGEDPDDEDPDGEDPDDDLAGDDLAGDDLAGDDLAGDDLAGDGDPEDAIPGLTPAGTDTTGHEVTAPDRVTQA